MTAPRIVLIHATRVAIDPIEAAFARHWPEAELVSVLDESLAKDRASGRADAETLAQRILALTQYAVGLGAKGILFTCSSFGPAVEAAQRAVNVPVHKPNQAMYERALEMGDDLVLLYSFPPAVEAMSAEFATQVGQGAAQLRPIFVEGALAALQAGDPLRHDALIAEAAAQVRTGDAIMLAQFSMASAQPAAAARASLPVLTSPDTAVAALRTAVLTPAVS